MKSKEVKLSNSLTCAMEALQEVERASRDAGLNREQTNIQRLLTEEMITMTTDILKDCKGSFWMEWEDHECQLHLTAKAPIEPEARDAFIKASKQKVNAPVKGVKNKISALMAGMLCAGDFPEFYASVSAGFVGGVPVGIPSMSNLQPVWSLSTYEKNASEKEKFEEMEGVEQSILTGIADDVVVSVKSYWVEIVVKKKYEPVVLAAMPKFTGLSHICIFVDDMNSAVSYYRKLLGTEVEYYLPHWKNEGFFKAGGFMEQAVEGEVSIAFVGVPGTRLTLELMQYHNPKGRTEPILFSANDVSGARHVALKVTNIDQAFAHVKQMPDTVMINSSKNYRPFEISPTKPEEVRFYDQGPGQIDQRNEKTAEILSGIRYFYFIDKYGLQWEFEQGHTDIGD